jgi:hypothetical protein
VTSDGEGKKKFSFDFYVIPAQAGGTLWVIQRNHPENRRNVRNEKNLKNAD